MSIAVPTTITSSMMANINSVGLPSSGCSIPTTCAGMLPGKSRWGKTIYRFLG